MNTSSKRIMVVDDNKFMSNYVEDILKKEKYEKIVKVFSGKEAIEVAKSWKPDIIILDIVMPDINGYDICMAIRKFSKVPIIFLSSKEEEVDMIVAFTVGGDDYIKKPFSPKELVVRMEALLRRVDYQKIHNLKVVFGEYELDKNRRELYRNSSIVLLTAKEYDLLEYLVENKDLTVSKEHILEEVWGYDYYGDDNTLMVHIRRLREKIEKEPSRPRYILTVKGRGYRFENPVMG